MKKQVSECSDEELRILANICQIWQLTDDDRIDKICLNTIDLIVVCSDVAELTPRVRLELTHRVKFREALESNAKLDAER